VGDADVLFDSITGVKQGCTGAPTFFNVYFQVANEVVDLLTLAPSLQFKTKQDHVFTGRSIQTHSAIDFSFDKSLYADDKTKLYATRMELQEGMQLIYTVFKRFGLTCHVGRNNAKSKTEAMYFPPPGVRYEDADTSPLLIDTGEDTGEISFTPTFKLLGSTLAKNLKDDTEVELRIKSAQGAFSAIRKQFFSAKGINNTHKKTAYEGLILSILLYGCETFSLPKQLLNRLQLFHNNCVRATSGGRPVQTSCTPCRLCRLFKPFKTTENKTLEFRSREVGDVIRPIKLIGIRKEPVQHGEKGGIFNV
jgi:hypothetical protein